jgi:hypothetical protein
MMSPAMPLPLPAGTTSAVGLGAASPIAPNLTDGESTPDVPPLQGQAFATFRLAEAWDAGPTVLIDMDRRLTSPRMAGGLFVRRWLHTETDELCAAVRVELGWAWAGVGLDLAFPLGSGAWLTASPAAVLTPDALLARVPLGALVEAGPVDAALETGVTVGTDGQGRIGAAPYVGVKVQLRFGEGSGDEGGVPR